jgi:uncharacterized protein YdgA (DUF945 family)
MNKKISVLLGIVILVLFVIFPFSIGYLFEHNYSKVLATLADNLNMDLRVIQYKKGWFHSDIVIAANFPLADNPLPNEKINNKNALLIKQRIHYGPIIFSLYPYQGVTLALASIDSYLDEKHLLAQTTLAFNTSMKTHLDLAQYSLNNKNLPVYTLEGLKGDIYLNSPKNYFSAVINCQHIFANLNQARHIEGFSTECYLKKSEQGRWTGTRAHHFNELRWQQGDTLYSFNHFDHRVDSKMVNNRYQATVQDLIQATKINQTHYGPQEISFTVSGIDSIALKQLQEIFPLSGKQVSASQEFDQAQHQLLALLNKGAKLEINTLLLNTAWGKVIVNASFECPCNQKTSHFSELVSIADKNLTAKIPVPLANLLLTDFYILQSGTVDRALAKSWAEATLTRWQQSGWLLNTGTDFLINLKWQPSHYTIT